MIKTEHIDDLISQLREIKKANNKRNKLSEKAFNLDRNNNTPKQLERASNNLIWACMDLDKQVTKFARSFKESPLNVSTEEKEYNPTGFHRYKA